MATYESLRQAIDTLIKTNGNEEITGAILNNVLNAMITALGANYQFCGEATPSTNPGQPLQNVFYFAYDAGTYVNFGNITLPMGISTLSWDGTRWTGDTIYQIDSTPILNSNNMISSGAVYNALIGIYNAIGYGKLYEGIATPSTVPSPLEGIRKFYIATQAGTYTNFLSNGDIALVLPHNGLYVIYSITGEDDDDWNYEEIFGIDGTPLLNSTSLITSGAVYNAISGVYTSIGIGKVFAGIAVPSTTPEPINGIRMFYIATQAGTYSHFFANYDIPLVLPHDGLYVIYSTTEDDDWNWEEIVGFDNVPTSGSDNLVRSGGVFNELALGAVYDVSAKNPTAGPNNDGKFTSLSALLNDANLNTLIPVAFRKGGMSIKFVLSSDNNYVQFLLKAQSFTTDVTQWQGVDEDVKDKSKNLVESGGVAEALLYEDIKLADRTITVTSDDFCGLVWDGSKVSAQISGYNGIVIRIHAGYKYICFQGGRKFASYPQINDVGEAVSNVFDGFDGYVLFTVQITFTTGNITINYPDNIQGQLNQLKANGTYFYCITAANTALKYIHNSNFKKELKGGEIIKFKYKNTVSSGVKMSMGNASNIDLYYNGAPVTDVNTWENEETVQLFYDGTYFQCYRLNQSFKSGEQLKDVDIKTISDNVNNLVDAVGEEAKTTTYSSDDYCGMMWNGTKVVAATAAYNGFIIPVKQGITYSSGRSGQGFQARVFSSYPVLNSSAGYVRTSNTTFVAQEGEKYIMIAISLATQTDYVLALSSYGLIKKTEDLEIKDKSLENFNQVGRKFVGQYDNIIYQRATGVVANTDSLNGFVIYSPKKDTKTNLLYLGGVPKDAIQTIKCYTSFPTIGNINNANGTWEWIGYTKMYRVKQQDLNYNMYLLVTVDSTKVDISKVFYSYDNFAVDNALLGMEGMNILCLGDSITEFKGNDSYTYPEHLAFITGANVYGCGVGGTRLSRRMAIDTTTEQGSWAALDIVSMTDAIISGNFSQQVAAANYLYSQNPNNDKRAIVTRLSNIDYDSLDYIFVMGGANDWTANVPIGTDTDEGDYTTIKGALRKIIRNLCTRCPKVKVVIGLETPKYYNRNDPADPDSGQGQLVHANWGDVYHNGNDDTLRDVIDAIAESAKFNTTPIIDLHNGLGWNEFNWSEYYYYVVLDAVDGSHPFNGFRYLAEFVAKHLKAL